MGHDPSDALNPYRSPLAGAGCHTAGVSRPCIPVASNPHRPVTVTLVGRGWTSRRFRLEGLVEAELACAPEYVRVNGRTLRPKLFARPAPFEFDLETPSETFPVTVDVRCPFLYPLVTLHVRIYVDGKLIYCEGR